MFLLFTSISSIPGTSCCSAFDRGSISNSWRTPASLKVCDQTDIRMSGIWIIQGLWAVSQLMIFVINEYIGKSHSGIWKKHVFLMFRNTDNKGTTKRRLVIKQQYVVNGDPWNMHALLLMLHQPWGFHGSKHTVYTIQSPRSQFHPPKFHRSRACSTAHLEAGSVTPRSQVIFSNKRKRISPQPRCFHLCRSTENLQSSPFGYPGHAV